MVVDSFDQVSVVVTFTEDFDNYEFAINGAFTAPYQINGTNYVFEGLFPGTEYRISAYNFNGLDKNLRLKLFFKYSQQHQEVMFQQML